MVKILVTVWNISQQMTIRFNLTLPLCFSSEDKTAEGKANVWGWARFVGLFRHPPLVATFVISQVRHPATLGTGFLMTFS